VLVVISDLYDDPDAIVAAVQPLRFRGNDIIVFHVLDPTELEFGFSDAQPFEDLESGEQMPVVPEAFPRGIPVAGQGAHRRADAGVFGGPRRLHAARHFETPRLRAVPVPQRAIENDEVKVLAREFLAPLFFAALAGLAIPVLLHLTQREKKQIIRFPSLMFVRRIPYQSVRRRKIQHWLLLLVRVTALALIIFAFARPFIRQSNLPGRSRAPARASWSSCSTPATAWALRIAGSVRARPPTTPINKMSGSDRGSVVLFSSGADIAVRASMERSPLSAAIAAANPARAPRDMRRR
jgi:hypothetical protein